LEVRTTAMASPAETLAHLLSLLSHYRSFTQVLRKAVGSGIRVEMNAWRSETFFSAVRGKERGRL
ncbi:MAG TPA: hypothetical protein PLQ88_17285, partial [Blastocatellia bacterium]|nr:hypothetical protein [Blastocatellia bacterium]